MYTFTSTSWMYAQRRLPFLAPSLALMVLALACRGNPTTVLTRLEESRRVTTDLRVHFSQVADASSRAVMADTEEASVAAVRESKSATGAVEKEAAALERLFESLSYMSETLILRDFNARFAEYRKLDGRIVTLALENTQIVELSRRNTNMLLLDLSLRQKPALVATCNERLLALQEVLAREGPNSTR